MRAAIPVTTLKAACSSDSNASPSSSSSSSAASTFLQLVPAPRTPHGQFHCSTITRSIATSMFEVPLDNPCSDFHVEGSLLRDPLNHQFSTNSTFQHAFFKDNQGKRHRKNGRQRFRAQLLSFPQGLNKHGDFLSVIGSTGLPMARSGQLQGTGGVGMALVVALITLLAAAQQGLSMGINQHQEMSCLMCNGLRFHTCSLCKGRGVVEWEGKLKHTDPCPRCLGSRRIKCSKCGL